MLNGTSVIQPVNPDLVKLYCVHEEKTDEVDQLFYPTTGITNSWPVLPAPLTYFLTYLGYFE